MAPWSLKSSPSSNAAQSPTVSSASLSPPPSVRSTLSSRSRPSATSTSPAQSIRRAPSPVSMYSGLEASMLGAPPKPRPLVKLDKTKKEPKTSKSKAKKPLPSPPSSSSLSTPSSALPSSSTLPTPKLAPELPPAPKSHAPRKSIAGRFLPRPTTPRPSTATGERATEGKLKDTLRHHASTPSVSEDVPVDVPFGRANISRASVWGRPGVPDTPAQHWPLDEEGSERPMSRESDVHVLVSSKEKGTWQEREVQDVIWQLRGLRAK